VDLIMLEKASHAAVSTYEIWDLVIKGATPLLIVIGGLFGLGRFVTERKDDRAWRRTELISQLIDFFENDERIQEAMKIISAAKHGRGRLMGRKWRRTVRLDLSRILSPTITGLSDEELDARHCLDRYLDFFDRLYTFIHGTQTISARELFFFVGFLEEVEDIPELKAHAERWYGPIFDLHAELLAARDQVRPEQGVRSAFAPLPE
jgi:hypothetical protein